MTNPLRRIIVLLLAFAALNACENRRPAADATETDLPVLGADTVAAADPVVVPSRFAVADTVAPFRNWPGSFDSAQTAPVVELTGQRYRLHLTARADSSQPLLYVRPYAGGTAAADTADSETQANRTFRGVEVQYTIALRNARGQSVFTRHLTKQPFRVAVGSEWVTDAEASAPRYIGRWPQRRALVFRFNFIPGPGDFGATSLLLLDERTGSTKELIFEEIYGSTNSPDTRATLAPGGATLLLPHELRFTNGRRKSLERPGYDLAAARLLDDSTILVSYEPAEELTEAARSMKKSQTVLLNLRGRQLKSFAFSPVSRGLGYWMGEQYLAQIRTYYFYDSQALALLLVPREAPLQARLVHLSTLPKFRLPRLSTEVRFGFRPENGGAVTLWVDTVGGQMRYEQQTTSY